MLDDALSELLFLASEYPLQSEYELGLTCKDTLARLRKEVLRVNDAFILQGDRHHFDIKLILFESKIRL